MNYKIAAVVVTFNRLELLKECVQSLRNQTHKLDEIYIINNSSTDGTLQWLNDQSDLTVITQENSGSAGGQHTGIKTAYEKGYDKIWCFDDDCFAEENALNNLLNTDPDKLRVLNSIVISNNKNSNNLSFGLYDKQNDKVFRRFDEINSELIPSANFFNGTYLSSFIIKTVGYPLKEFFIRGEEYEYYLRILHAGFKVFTVKSSKVYHQPEKKQIYDSIFFRYEYLVLDAFKRYYFIRNLTVITKIYQDQRMVTLLKIFFLDLIILFSKFKFKLLSSELRGFIDGMFLRNELKNICSL